MSLDRMRFPSIKQITTIIGMWLAVTQGVFGTDAVKINTQSVTNYPIDATVFINEGYFETSSSLPYETANTVSLTNRGTMAGSVGFRFNCFTNGFRRRSLNFVNESVIRGNDPTNFFFFNGNLSTAFASYIYVNSTNIINRGAMQVSSSGLLQLTGNNIDLKGGALVAGSLTASTSFRVSNSSSNYFNDAKITDLYWGVGTNNVFSGPGFGIDLINGQMDTNSAFFGSGYHEVIDSDSNTNYANIPNNSFFNFSTMATNFATFAISNRVAPTSSVIQVVFVSTNVTDPELKIDTKFSTYNGGGGIRGREAIVQFSVRDTNILTGLPSTNALYFIDYTPIVTANTNLFYQDNFFDTTARPNSYDVTFSTPFEWQLSPPNTIATNRLYTPSLLFDPTFHLNPQPDNLYAAYSVYVGSVVSTNAANSVILNEPTNSVGRVEIIGDNVDVNLSRVHSDGLLTITATNFQALKEGARLEAEQMRLNLTSTNKTFILTNILSSTVRRIGGTLSAYSAIWTNQTITGEEIRYHVLILDNQLTSTKPSTAYGFTMRVTNQPNSSIVIEDPLTVARDLFLDATNITVRSTVTVSDSLSSANMPSVLNFTNEGTLVIPNSASFTRAGSQPYSSFVNHSSITANGIFVSANYLENTGLIGSLTGSVTLSNGAPTSLIKLVGGQLFSTVDMTLVANQLNASNAFINTGYTVTNFSTGEITYNLGGLVLKANSLLDNPAVTNYWTCLNGFQLLKLGGGGWTGGLLNTELQSIAKPFGYIEHKWSGFDLGVTVSGFTNNAALGKLILDAPTTAIFKMSAPGNGNWALYVDYLDLRNYATNWQNAVQLDPNFRIYFADCSVRPEKLNGVNGFYWVKDYVGRYSSTNVVINGQSRLMNRALYTSKEVDSDGDGIPNASDSSPFDGVVLSNTSLTTSVPRKISINWQAAADTDYTVEYATNVLATNTPWATLTLLHTTSAGLTNVLDSVSSGLRVYRVRYTP